MESVEFERMVARLEVKSRRSPSAYQANVALLALVGFGLLTLIVGTAGAAIVALIGVPVAMWVGGVHAYWLFVGAGKLLLLLAIPLWLLIKSTMSALLTRFPRPEGIELLRIQAPELFTALDHMRHKMRGPRFHHVLISHELNAAVVQRPMFGLFGPPRNYLIVGLPLLESLSPDEALAVVAHEYGHLAGSHSHFGAFIYRLRLTWTTVYLVSHQWTGSVSKALRRLVGLYVPYFNAYSFVLARANEYQADAAAAQLVSAGVVANALMRVEVCGTHFNNFLQGTYKTAKDNELPPGDVFSRWAQLAHSAPASDANRWLKRALALPGGVDDTHPPLRARLLALLGGNTDSLPAHVPPNVATPSAAQIWLGGSAQTVRESIQTRWCDRVATPWKREFEEANEQRQKLDKLRALPNPNEKEHSERLRLQLEYAPDTLLAEDMDVFIAAYPANVLGPYLLGNWRLTQNDDNGLEHLDRAIALDAAVTKPVCERALAYLSERDDPRTQDYERRWKERDMWDREAAPQLAALDVAHELCEPDVSEEQMETIRALMQANRAGIARAFLVRRKVPADPSFPTYVLALQVEPKRLAIENSHQIVNRLAETETWPVHMFFVVLDGKHKVLLSRILALPNAEITLQPLE